MKITLLGAGNVATQLALGLRKAGHHIVQIYNRSNEAGEELAHTVGASFTSNTKKLEDADVYLIAVKDDSIADVASQLKVNDKIVAHTSGTKKKELLSFSSSNFGIFYPLQTMTKLSKVDFTEVPMLIEGNDEKTLAVLEELAASISKRIHRVDEQQRQWIHVAAVFANNFTNHIYSLSEHLLAEHDLPFEIVKPLIFKAVDSLHHYSPSELQTGPAVRGDRLTVEHHLRLLAREPRLQKIYQMLTESIVHANKK